MQSFECINFIKLKFDERFGITIRNVLSIINIVLNIINIHIHRLPCIVGWLHCLLSKRQHCCHQQKDSNTAQSAYHNKLNASFSKKRTKQNGQTNVDLCKLFGNTLNTSTIWTVLSRLFSLTKQIRIHFQEDFFWYFFFWFFVW